MRTLDRYIIRQFLLNFVILAFVLTALFMLVDFIVQLDEFVKAIRQNPVAFGGTVGTILWVLLDWYGPLIPLLYVFFSGVLVMGAMGFTLAGLHRTRELTAMLTSGISMYRIAAPIVVTGAVLSALALPIQELLIPRLAPKLARTNSQVGQAGIHTFAVSFSPDGARNLVSAVDFDPEREELRDLTILVRMADGSAPERISAAKGRWDDGRGGWVLDGGTRVLRQASVSDRGEVRRREPQPVAFFKTDLSPQVLLARRAAIYTRLLSLRELQGLLRLESADRIAILKVMHSRFSLLMANVLVLVMVLPFFLLREPTNLLMQGVKASLLGLGAWGAALVMLQADPALLPPVTAAWMPVIVFLPLSAGVLTTVRT